MAVAAFTSDSSSFHLRQHIDASCELQFKACSDSDLKSVRDRAALGPSLGELAEGPGVRAMPLGAAAGPLGPGVQCCLLTSTFCPWTFLLQKDVVQVWLLACIDP